MPRIRRSVGDSGFYHVVSKGEADQILFYDDDDRAAYVALLDESCKDFSLLIHAYCLMSNHVHLVLQDQRSSLSAAMKQLNERYAIHFKTKTGRTGHVFKNRYWSEPIESDEYLLSAVRYVHANPAVAGICMAAAYPWSSTQDYLGRKGITATEMVLQMTGGREGFIRFSKQAPTAKAFPSSRLRGHLSKEEVAWIARTNLSDDMSFCASVRALRSACLSNRQIAELLDSTVGYVRKVA